MCTLKGHSSYVHRVSFTSDGTHLISESPSETKVWEVSTMQETTPTAGLEAASRNPTRQPVRLDWLPDKEFAIVASGDQVKLYGGNEQLGTAFRAKSAVDCVCRCGDTDRIMIICSHGEVVMLSCPFLGR